MFRCQARVKTSTYYVFTYICVCMYVCMYVCMCIYVVRGEVRGRYMCDVSVVCVCVCVCKCGFMSVGSVFVVSVVSSFADSSNGFHPMHEYSECGLQYIGH